jgi:hypothetical protein
MPSFSGMSQERMRIISLKWIAVRTNSKRSRYAAKMANTKLAASTSRII